MRAFTDTSSSVPSPTDVARSRWGVFAPMPSEHEAFEHVPSPQEWLEQKAALRQAEAVIHTQGAKLRTLEALAVTDPLTGLMNRRGFFSAFERELALVKRDVDNEGSLVLVDLDAFKDVNDTWGHRMGDAYLRAAAKALCASVRSTDSVARIGGDKFAILLPRLGETVATARLEKVTRLFGRTRVLPEKLLLKASFGMAFYTASSCMDDVFHVAERRLYAAKAKKQKITSADEAV